MIGFSLKTTLNLGPLHNYPKHLQAGARATVVKVAHMMRDDMEANAPKDTGALSVGIYVVSKHENGYAAASAAAHALRPKVPSLPSLPGTNSDYTSKIGLTQPYWPFLEYGTATQPAQPFVRPAIERGKTWFADEMIKVSRISASKSGWIT